MSGHSGAEESKEEIKHNQFLDIAQLQLKVEAEEEPKRDFYCWRCSQTFSTQHDLLSNAHQCVQQSTTDGLPEGSATQSDNIDTTDFQCSIKQEIIITEAIYIKEEEIEVKKEIEDVSSTNIESENEDDNEINVKHKCRKLYECTICTKSFKDKSKLSIHNRTHTGEKPYECVICKKSFSLKCNLKVHNRIHSGEKLYECELCKKCFRRKDDLNKHNQTHTGEKPYQCEICKKCFSRQNELVRHNRIHSGEKPFQCIVCKKCFSERSNLAKHNRIHTGEKPFQCHICKKCFTESSALKRHLRIHTGEKSL